MYSVNLKIVNKACFDSCTYYRHSEICAIIWDNLSTEIENDGCERGPTTWSYNEVLQRVYKKIVRPRQIQKKPIKFNIYLLSLILIISSLRFSIITLGFDFNV